MKHRIIRICIVAGLTIILIQIWTLPTNEGYIDLLLVEPASDGYQLASSTEVNKNQTTIFPFLRNVMGRSLIINISIFGQNSLNEIKTSLEFNPKSTWIIKNDKPAKSTEFLSSWDIVPFNIYNISDTMNFLNLSLSYYDNQWIDYGSVNIRLIH